jgi:threonylcarbamoyladenosine tRNA methylthiotransferase MtaB
MPSFAVRNFGCRANQAEAFAWSESLRERGLRLDEEWRGSDVVVVNSCTLTGRADRDVRKFIRTAARVNPAVRIVVTGCLSEREPEGLAAMPNVVAVWPQSAKDGLAERLEALAAAWGHVPEVRVPDPPLFRRRAFLKVQEGCDARCAFCVIPSVRGRSRSVSPATAVAEAARLAGRGYREIVLAGIHLSSYGRDLEPRSSLLDLLKALEAGAPSVRLRLSSLDPRLTDDALVAHIASSPAVRPHFHLSLQHAAPAVLRAMGRPVEPGSYERLLDELRRRSPDAALGADLIVGFPGETEAEFAELVAFVETSPLTYVHAFPYSPRRGTPAADRPALPAAVVTARAGALRRLSEAKDLSFRRGLAGREFEAVVIRRKGRGARVLTANGVGLDIPECGAPERETVRIVVRAAHPCRTEGEAVR